MKAIVNTYSKNKVAKPKVEIRNSFGNKGDDSILYKPAPPVVKRNAVNAKLLSGTVFKPSTPKLVTVAKKSSLPVATGKAKATFLKKTVNRTKSVFGSRELHDL